MEKIKVNMSPNPLDVQTIHASQNDAEARQWEFELHNNGELIDTSDVSEQMFFKAYKGGTEQILPENTSTPTTSPFLGDIRYPQGLLTDQEFLYRESPTEEDGLAKITDVKGNTLVWNQLVQNGNFVDTSLWRTYSSTGFSVSNNVGSFTVTGTTGAIYQTNTPTYVSGHKYLVIADFYVSQQSNISIEVSGTRGRIVSVNANTWYRYSDIVAPSAQGNFSLTCGQVSVQVRNVMCFDLTQMGLDISNPSDFTSLFSLPYYAYNQGTLLSFMGNGIKTVGKNLIELSSGTLANSQRISIAYENNGATFTAEGIYARAGYVFKTIVGRQYTLSFKGSSTGDYNCIYLDNSADWEYSYGLLRLTSTEQTFSNTFTATSDVFFIGFYVTADGASGSMYIKDIQLEFGSTATAYEPYTESVLNLPISTYFPTGMKEVNAYDELTPSKATTRIGEATFNGSENWYYDSNNRLFRCAVANAIITDATTQYNVYTKNNRFDDKSWATRSDGSLGMYYGASYIFIKSTQFADVSALKTWLQSNPVTVYFELATPTETSFTTASLVTENAEIPLSNEDGVLIGKCTEELSAEPGFHDAKIKLSDGDGTCYSNKIQLHVERSPQ